MSVALITKRFLSKAIDFKNEGNKNKWVTDLVTELESTIDAVNLIIPVTNAAQPSGSYITGLTGDITATGPGSVAATLANIAANSILGNNTGSPAHQIALTAAQVKTFLAIVEADITLADNTTGDVTTARHGFAPKAPNNTTTFLRGDATYAAPNQPIYDSGILGAATTEVDIGSLHFDTDGGYRFQFIIEQGANGSVSFYVANDLTDANYRRDANSISGGANVAVSTSNAIFATFSNTADEVEITGDVFTTPAGITTIRFAATRIGGGAPDFVVGGIRWLTTNINPAQINIQGSAANTIGINSRLRLWKMIG